MSSRVVPERARQFAERIVRTLRQHGHDALWAGGCVRDQLLGRPPNDFDVATSAEPEQVRDCFGYRRTLPIGAAFGVITVQGRPGEGQIEVATFRRDLGYSDGRHPDQVAFSNARHDALRRDFTINGLFYDPLNDVIIDYVGGQEDIESRKVRAIGDPFQRFQEDKLRMLRAVRFAAILDFDLESSTRFAIRQQAEQILGVSAERIAGELRKMLVHANRAKAMELLQQVRLLDVIFPESRCLFANSDHATGQVDSIVWQQTLAQLNMLSEPTFRVALAALLWNSYQLHAQSIDMINQICSRWKLSNHEATGTAWLLRHESMVRSGSTLPWPQLQRVLVSPDVDELINLATAVARATGQSLSGVEYCQGKLRLPAAEFNPAPLITGDDLHSLGMVPGPSFRSILTDVRDRQLLGQIQSRDDAIVLARQLADDNEKHDTLTD